LQEIQSLSKYLHQVRRSGRALAVAISMPRQLRIPRGRPRTCLRGPRSGTRAARTRQADPGLLLNLPPGDGRVKRTAADSRPCRRSMTWAESSTAGPLATGTTGAACEAREPRPRRGSPRQRTAARLGAEGGADAANEWHQTGTGPGVSSIAVGEDEMVELDF
jgi:hypothetical protein